MKIYIAGKITGDPNYRQKFNDAAEKFPDDTILNPSTLPAGLSSADYMRICLAMIDSADMVAFLPDWNESRGARLENDYCQYVGKQTFYVKE